MVDLKIDCKSQMVGRKKMAVKCDSWPFYETAEVRIVLWTKMAVKGVMPHLTV